MENEPSVEKKGSKKMILAVAILVILLVIVYLVFGMGKAASTNSVSSSGTGKLATVNGVEISKALFDSQLAAAVASYKAQGVDVQNADKLKQIETQVLNGLIDNEVVSQATAKAGFSAAQDEVEKQFQAILTQVGGADKLKAELAKANLTEAQLRDNIAKQLAVQKYMLQNIDTKSLTVSDDEVAKAYADSIKGQTNVPKLAEVSNQIKQELLANKQQTLVAAFIASLRQKAEVVTSK